MAEVIAAGLVLYRSTEQGPVWLVLRNSLRQEWGLAKGHAEPGEDAERCARRECAEECGIAVLRLCGPQWQMSYTLPDGRDKSVHYFLAETCQHQVVLSNEHDAYHWLLTDQAIEIMAFDNMRQLLRDAAAAVPALPTPDVAA